jgi:putative intracellular protease/amidase
MLIHQSAFISLLIASTAVFGASSTRGGGVLRAEGDSNANETPRINWGVVIFPGFEPLDVFGPTEYIHMISLLFPTNLSFISHSLDPVTSKIPEAARHEDVLPSVSQVVLPTHTFDNPPPLDVIIVPGGGGAEVEVNGTAVPEFLRAQYPVSRSFASDYEWLMVV